MATLVAAAAAGPVLAAVLSGSLGGVASPSGSASAAPAAAPVVDLSMTFRGRAPGVLRANLVCRGRVRRAGGYLARRDPRTLCARARRLGPLLAGRPDPQRLCTMVYGGPETARLRGRIGARRIGRSLSRRDGCEIADWDRTAGLLPPVPRAPGP